MGKHALIIQAVLVLFIFSAAAQEPENFDLSLRRISPEGGFTYGAITAIGEDADGFIWFGTTHGLYRYNSVDIRKFTNSPVDSTSIPNNSIRAIFCDKNGSLWIGTAHGLSVYDNSREVFKLKVLSDKEGENLGNNIYEIFQGDGDNIYILSSVMLGRLNLMTNEFDKVPVDKSDEENFAGAVYDASGKIWIAGSQGTVWLYDIQKGQSRQFFHLREESIRKVFADENGLWIAYNFSGLDYVGFDGQLKDHYGSGPGDKSKIHHNRVRDIYKDELGRIWIATYKGLSVIDDGRIINLLPQELSGLPYNSIFSMFRDSKGGIWIGTWSGGLAYISKFDNRFVHFSKDNPMADQEDEFVSSFAELPDGTVLIGTEFGNLNRMIRNTRKMTKIPLATENGLKIENIKSLLYDSESETLWIGTFLGGLWYQKKNERVLRKLDLFTDVNASVYAMAKSDSGIWVGTFGSGLYHYNVKLKSVSHYLSSSSDSSLSNNQIRAIEVASDGSIWVGTNGGVNRFLPGREVFRRFVSNPDSGSELSSNEIYSLKEDSNGAIWIGTSGGGINKYDPSSGTFKHYQSKDGLAGDDVYGIVEDSKGTIWVSTENGISGIDRENFTIRNFYREQELQGHQFNPGAAFISRSGEVMFGNTRGFIMFSPEGMKSNPYAPKVILTSLLINNIPVDFRSQDSPLEQNIQTAKLLRLPHDKNSLTFTFVANNFLLPDKNRFRYRLVNYSDAWVDAGTQNYATFTKIPPGSYTLEIIACNNDNLWNDQPTQLKIVISPPLWFSWYAYLIYSAIFVLSVWFLRKFIIERQRFKKELILERLINESEARIHEMKLQFFTNISHEFRTPLTLISSPVNSLLARFDLEPVVKEYLLTMQRNSNRLLKLINQLIDVHKIDLGKAVLKPVTTNLVELCRHSISCFEMEARDRRIQLSFIPEDENLKVNADPEKVDMIFFNILSNAMKFSPEGGAINISMYTSHSDELAADAISAGDTVVGSLVCTEFRDEGPGIDPEEIKLIFERFGQGRNHQSSGTGIGLHLASEYTRMHGGKIIVRSAPGVGSSFVICLPLNEVTDQPAVHYDGILAPDGTTVSETEDKDYTLNREKKKTSTILIIEDNHELRSYLNLLLGRDYRIATAPNGTQGLEIALTMVPDLIITDIIMPQMDGYEVCRRLKNDIRTSHIPVILLTALDQSDSQIGGFKTGADAYITKPFDDEVLSAQVENLISSRAKLRKIFSVSDSEWADGMEIMTSDRVLIEKAGRIVEKHLNDKAFIVDHLAAGLGISPSSLYRKLKVLTNQSPTEFIRYIRLKKAINLLNDGNSNVDEVGYAVGFNSHSYFTTSFKKQFGKTPSEYLSEVKTKKNV